MKTLLLIFTLVLIGCQDDNLSPEAALKSFVEARMGQVVSRDFILERVTGKLKLSLENVTDEDFQKFADLRNVSQGGFKVLSKSCQNDKCFVTYSLSYKSHTSDKATFASEVKKIAEVVKVEGRWLISDVSNIKTYHEALEPINPIQ